MDRGCHGDQVQQNIGFAGPGIGIGIGKCIGIGIGRRPLQMSERGLWGLGFGLGVDICLNFSGREVLAVCFDGLMVTTWLGDADCRIFLNVES